MAESEGHDPSRPEAVDGRPTGMPTNAETSCPIENAPVTISIDQPV